MNRHYADITEKGKHRAWLWERTVLLFLGHSVVSPCLLSGYFDYNSINNPSGIPVRQNTRLLTLLMPFNGCFPYKAKSVKLLTLWTKYTELDSPPQSPPLTLINFLKNGTKIIPSYVYVFVQPALLSSFLGSRTARRNNLYPPGVFCEGKEGMAPVSRAYCQKALWVLC